MQNGTRLCAVTGPSAGLEFAVPEGTLTVGRSPSCDIALSDASVSRQHCEIVSAGGRSILRDLGSHNRTRVNGQIITEYELQEGDSIEIGRSTLVFTSTPISEGPRDSATMVLRSEDAIYAGGASAAPPAAEHFRVLLEAGRLTSSEISLDSFARRLMELVARSIPSESAAVILGAPEQEAESWRRYEWTRPGTAPLEFPASIVRRVMRERVSLWCNDVFGQGGLVATESILQAQLSAVMGVPLIVCENLLGVLSLASRQSGARFTEADLQLLTGIAAMTAGGIRNLDQMEALQEENRRLEETVERESNLVGAGDAIRAVHSFVAKVAPSDATVLITGESGTGKELVARAIHRNSPRAGRPFIAINCATLSESLLESEMFGHEKGSFTGAIAQKRGKLEEAHTGTVFLDEIGEMNAALQARLLRVLQEREFERVGGTRPIKVDVRIVAATNRDLPAMVKAGTFRADLYYRINVVSVHLPPLRLRRDDIPALARHFIIKHARHAGRKVTGIATDAMALLKRYDWPGNVRELENVMERALVLGSTETVLRDDLPEALLEAGAGAGVSGDFHERVNEAKRAIVMSAVEEAGGSYTEAARTLGIHANNLHRLIRNLGLRDRRS
jgi:Nif-specific regulatory protein